MLIGLGGNRAPILLSVGCGDCYRRSSFNLEKMLVKTVEPAPGRLGWLMGCDTLNGLDPSPGLEGCGRVEATRLRLERGPESRLWETLLLLHPGAGSTIKLY